MSVDENGSGYLAIKDLSGPQSLTFALNSAPLFTIKPDGTIVRGPAFTTEDEASLKFWEHIQFTGFQLAKSRDTMTQG